MDGVVERAARALERVEHRVEAQCHAADLVVPGGLDAPPEVLGLGDVLGGGRQVADGLDHAAREQAAQDRGQQRAAGAQRREHEPQPRQRRVDVGEAAHELDRAAAGQRHRQHAQVDALGMRVAQHRPPLTGRDLPVDIVDGHRDVGIGGPLQDVAPVSEQLRGAVGISRPRGGRWQT